LTSRGLAGFSAGQGTRYKRVGAHLSPQETEPSV
jgi:hypothetical protein